MRKLFYVNNSGYKTSLNQTLRQAEESATINYIREKCSVFIAQMIELNIESTFGPMELHNFNIRCSKFFKTINVHDFGVVYDESIWMPQDIPRNMLRVTVQLSSYLHAYEMDFSISNIKKKYNL